MLACRQASDSRWRICRPAVARAAYRHRCANRPNPLLCIEPGATDCHERCWPAARRATPVGGSADQQSQGPPTGTAAPIDRIHFFVSNLAPLIAMKDAGLPPGERLPLADLLGSERFRGVETAAAWPGRP